MKVLHISFHKGCENDIQYISTVLKFDLEFMQFDDGITKTNAKYNIGHDRANLCWNKYKDYFNTFDVIITSDTAPISRVFLQNNFQKRLIVWICNRFDYCDVATLDCDFPDKEYYDLVREAHYKDNVTVIGYTPFENYYAKIIRDVDVGDIYIKPIGNISSVYHNYTETNIENKETQFFIPPYHNDTIMMNLSAKITELGILNYSGIYNGPLDLVKYRGIIHIPYAWSNLALFENISLGIIYFIPSFNFLLEIKKDKDFYWTPPFLEDMLYLSEWYNEDNKQLFIYFDSWDDLKDKIENTNYKELKKNILKFSVEHEDIQIAKWKEVLKI